MSEPRWLTRTIVDALHAMLLAEHGGSAGVRDENGLEAALARPRQKDHYETADILEPAAAYAYGLSTGHPFVDGNKRMALAASDVFLRLNGWALDATEVDATATMIELAAGQLSEQELVAWVRGNAVRLP